MWPNRIYAGDCRDGMRAIPDKSIDLIVTSPPYASFQFTTHTELMSGDYGDWFMDRMKHMWRILKPRGSIILNIREGYNVDNELDTYVLDLIKRITTDLWLDWIDEYIWAKPHTEESDTHYRFQHRWERLLHFVNHRPSLERQPLNYKVKDVPDPPECVNNVITAPPDMFVEHHAAFPPTIPAYFINKFTDRGEMVLDPFCGTGTTCAVARDMGRAYIGIEKAPQHLRYAKNRLGEPTGGTLAQWPPGK